MSILLNFESFECGQLVFHIPDESKLPKELVNAILKMNGVYANTAMGLKTRNTKAMAILLAATRDPLEGVDEANPHKANLYAHALIPYLIPEESSEQKPVPLETVGKLVLVRSGDYAMRNVTHQQRESYRAAVLKHLQEQQECPTVEKAP